MNRRRLRRMRSSATLYGDVRRYESATVRCSRCLNSAGWNSHDSKRLTTSNTSSSLRYSASASLISSSSERVTNKSTGQYRLRNSDFGLRNDEKPAVLNPHSAFRNPQSVLTSSLYAFEDKEARRIRLDPPRLLS